MNIARNKKIFWILVVLSLISFWVSWTIIYFSFYGNGSHKWTFPIISFFISSFFFYLLIIIAKKAKTIYFITILLTIPAISSGGAYWYSMILIWGIAFLFYLIAIKRIKLEQECRININIYRILQRGIPIMGTSLSLLIAGGFYFSIISHQKVGETPRINIEFSDRITNGALRSINFLVPTDELFWTIDGATVDEYIEHTMKTQSNVNEAENFDDMKEFEKEMVVATGRETLGEQLGMKISGEDKLAKVINTLVNKRANEIMNGDLVSTNVVPIGAMFGMFITVRSLIWVLNMILYWIATGAFILLVKAKLLLIKKEEKEIEMIM